MLCVAPSHLFVCWCPAAPRRPVPVSRVMIAEMIREDLAWVGSIGLIGREAETDTMGPRHGLCGTPYSLFLLCTARLPKYYGTDTRA